MKFEVLHAGLLGRRDVVAVDTVDRPGMVGMSFTHHRSRSNDPRYAADTTTASVLRFLECDDVTALTGFTVTTNHFDADALLPVWALLHPTEALERRSLLERVARCGDFFLCLDEPSLKINLAIEALHWKIRGEGRRGERRVQDAVTRSCFRTFLPMLGELLDRPDKAEALWIEPFRKTLEDQEDLVTTGAVTEHWDCHTSVVLADRDLEPHAVNSLCKNDLILSWREDTKAMRLEVRPAIGWYELPSLPHQPRYDLSALAARLNSQELKDRAGWRHDAGAVSLSAAGAGLEVHRVLDAIRDWLRDEPDENVPAAYRADVRDVYRALGWPAVQTCHERFGQEAAVAFTPGRGYGGLYPMESGSTAFKVSDDFYWNRRQPEPLEVIVELEGATTDELRVEYDTWFDPHRQVAPMAFHGDTLLFRLDDARLANGQAGADFRLVGTKAPVVVKHVRLSKLR